ncbi:MAG: AsnC family transcriptional regulator, partial [Rhodobacteraceae bacterium]|nr:AsnC family transcriptional regulator [Paracoccaceae bacterium]
MNEIDKKLIQALTDNARAPLTDLARQLGIARTTVQSRIERLEKAGT